MINDLVRLFNKLSDDKLTSKQVATLTRCYDIITNTSNSRNEMIQWCNDNIKKWPGVLSVKLPDLPANCSWRWVHLPQTVWYGLSHFMDKYDVIRFEDVKLKPDVYNRNKMLHWLIRHVPLKLWGEAELPDDCGWKWSGSVLRRGPIAITKHHYVDLQTQKGLR